MKCPICKTKKPILDENDVLDATKKTGIITAKITCLNPECKETWEEDFYNIEAVLTLIGDLTKDMIQVGQHQVKEALQKGMIMGMQTPKEEKGK